MNMPRLKKPHRIFINWVLLFASFHFIALIGQYVAFKADIHEAKDRVERRISLDSAFLDVGNDTLNTPVNQFAIYRYIDRLNKALQEESYPVLVSHIQEVGTRSQNFDEYPVVSSTLLMNAEQHIVIELRSMSPLSGLGFSWFALGASIIVLPLFALATKRRRKSSLAEEEVLPPVPKLIINLKDKTLSNGIDEKAVALQNKPLCFYTALVKYCIENPSHPLPPHKDVPHELLVLANKSFGRLIELGHTKRKRPDFNANLDKTLSEIRAALDEVFSAYSEEKEIYYPPRAQGEGSRSKQHSYALPDIKLEDIEIIGN
jgi:hypothetical protein